MDKSEAAAVMHEIYDAIGESVCINSISLDDLDSLIVKGDKGYQIKMKCSLDNHSRRTIKPIIEKNHLTLKESNGYVLISKMQ